MESLKLKNNKYWDASGVFDHQELKTQEEINANFKNEFNEVIDGISIGPVQIATFDTNTAGMPLKGLTVNIEPVQAEGTPSPETPLPISGWTTCKLHRAGVSLIGGDAFVGYAFAKTANGYEISYSGSGLSNRGSNYANIKGLPAGRYVLRFLNCSYPDGIEVAFRQRTNGTLTSVGTIIGSAAFGSRAFNIPAGTTDLQFYIVPNETVAVGDKVTMDDVILFRESDVPEPYKGNTYDITFPTEAGTVYGGTFDVVNRKLNSYPYYSSYNGETLIGPWVSSMDVYSEGTSPTIGAQVVDMGGAATSYDLSDIPEVTTLFGENNIWANRGNVTVTYGAYLEHIADIDKEVSYQANRLTDVEQSTTATTIGPVVIASFDASAADMPLKGLMVNIEPVQAEGAPTPENPLSISGWTGANVFDDPKYALPINWNQIRTDSEQSLTYDGITTSYDPQTHLFTITNNSRTTNFGSGSTQCIASNVDPIPGHRYALLGESHAGVAVSAVNVTSIRKTENVGRIMTMTTATTNTAFKIRVTSDYDFVSAHPVGDVYSFYLNIVDITQLLGEEAAATATYDQIAEMFPNEWYPYNAGEITCVSAVNGDPYQKIAVNWEDEAGTVYGGTFDVVNRKLNSYPYYSSYNGETLIGPWVSSMDVYTSGATPTLGAQVVDMGRAATIYDLSDIPEITTLLGTNNIWSNCGDVTVTYGAYLETLKASLDRTNSDLVNLRACIAPTENGDTASQAYVQGAYFFRNGSFCVALLGISSGDQFTLGTNYKVVSVAEAILAMSFTILEQPHDVEASIGVDGTFSVVARGAADYIWQYWTPNSQTWKNSTTTTSDYTLEVTEARYTYRYRCKVTGFDGSVIYSQPVKYVRPS